MIPLHDLPTFIQNAVEPVYTRDELLARIDWDECATRLLGYARAKVWRHGTAGAGFSLQPPDLVQEAMAGWLDGRRKFECGTASECYRFLCGVIDSLVSHEREKTVRRGYRRSISKDGGDDKENDEMTEGSLRAEGDFEHDFLFRDNLERFIESLHGRLAAYARFVADYPDLSAEQRAEALEITLKDVRNLDRRLHRAGRQWMEASNEPQPLKEKS